MMIDLVIITGASGSGKSYLLSNFQYFGATFAVVKKKTTREPRTHENPNTNFEFTFDCPKEEVLNCEYHYEFRNELYGFNCSDIDALRMRDQTPMIIIRQTNEIKIMKEKYRNVIVVLCKCNWEDEKLIEHFQEKGISKQECQKRLFSHDEKKIKAEYAKNLKLFDLVLENNFDHTFLIQAKFFFDKKNGGSHAQF